MKYQMTLLIYVGLLLVFQTPVDTVCGTVRTNVFGYEPTEEIIDLEDLDIN